MALNNFSLSLKNSFNINQTKRPKEIKRKCYDALSQPVVSGRVVAPEDEPASGPVISAMNPLDPGIVFYFSILVESFRHLIP